MNKLQKKLLKEDLEKTDSAFTLYEIKDLVFDEAKLLSADTFRIWCYLNPESYKKILDELNRSEK